MQRAVEEDVKLHDGVPPHSATAVEGIESVLRAPSMFIAAQSDACETAETAYRRAHHGVFADSGRFPGRDKIVIGI
jgi:hypothetical protein